MTGRRIRLLIVTDDRELLRELRWATARWGYESTTASGAREAVRLLDDPPDLLLLDIDLPQGGAVFIAEAALSMEPAPGIVAVTGTASNRVVFEYGKAGVRGLVEKPVRWEALRDALIQAMAPRQER